MKERLKLLRKALGIKQRELAERLEVKVGTIGDWESGKPLPRARVIQICKEYGVNRTWLETGVGEMFEPEKEPKTKEDVLREAALALFEELSPRAQDAFLAAMAEITMKALEDKRGKSKTQPQSNPLRPERPNETLVAMRDIPGRMEG
jgi:transcriptional regulator with XRE-family HTH domain